jgi:iron complex outermembrane receptor protein
LVLSGYALYEDEFREDNFKRYGRITVGTRYRISDKLSIGFNSNFNKGNTQNYFYWKDWGPDALRGAENTFTNTDRFRFTIDPFVTYYDNSGNQHKIISRYHFIDNQNNEDQSNSSQLFYGEYQFQHRFEKIKLVTTAGIVGIRSSVQAELYGDTTYTTSNLAGYLQVEKKIGNRLNLSGGVRYERNTINGPEIVNGDTIPSGQTTIEGEPVFRFGLNYQLGKLTFLRASWGQGYRFPTIAEKFIKTTAGGVKIVPNPYLESETGWTAEIAIKQGFNIKTWEAYFDVAVFWSQYVKMMEFTASRAGFQSQNIGDTDIKGFEISIAGEGKLFGTTTSLLAGYTYIDPKFQEFNPDSTTTSVDYNILKYRSKHALKFDLETKINRFSVGFAILYNSHIEAIDKIFELIINGLAQQRMEDMDGYKTFDVRVAYQINKSIKVALIAKNIFNEEYTVRPGLLEAPTNITCRLDFKF